MTQSITTLERLCDLIQVQVSPDADSKANYIGLEHVASGKIFAVGSGVASELLSSKFAFNPGDVLYGKLRPYLDKCIIAHCQGVCTTELLVLRPRPEIPPAFLAGILHSPQFIEFAKSGTSGTNHPRTSWGHIKTFEFPEFGSDERKAIAVLILLLAKGINSQELLEKTLHGIKRAAQCELFSRGLRGEPLKETEIGLVPESWAAIPCEKIFKLTSGKTRPSNIVALPSGDLRFPVLGGNGVMGYSSKWFLDAPAILVIGRVGEYCGATHVASGKVWITDNALYAKEWLNSDAELPYVGAFLEYFDLNRFKRMAGQPLVTQGMIYEHSIPIPSSDEQREIVTILDTIDRKIDFHRRKRMVLEELFRTLLHKLMTGEIRIDDLDLRDIPALSPNTTVQPAVPAEARA